MFTLKQLKAQAQLIGREYFNTTKDISAKLFKKMAPWADLRTKSGWETLIQVLKIELERAQEQAQEQAKKAEKAEAVRNSSGYKEFKKQVDYFRMELRGHEIFDCGEYKGDIYVIDGAYYFEGIAGDQLNQANCSIAAFCCKVSHVA
ncbi:MAG: hypothetical protein F6J89_07030 [Symploca sp. SIO1C4]|uniref:Uncharacterized protein n=1 Tax=Symploca sp. SIO1C4 TaxID=2607765 RepID=A0A6B3NCL8_9CYAN|nr:hypothetical protein [Symploca sp. SIO1C4]